MFLPSGTMCNQVAIATHCRPGEEILAHKFRTSCPARAVRRGDRRCADSGADRRTRQVHRGHPGRRDPAGIALLADAACGGSRTDREPRRRRMLECRGIARGHRCGARARRVHPHGWRALDECRGGAWRSGVRPHRGLQFGVARFHQGPRRTFRRRAGRMPVHRPGVALEATAWRFDASGRHVRGGLASMHWNTTSIAWPRTTPTRNRLRAGWHKSPVSPWKNRKPTWCSSTRRAPADRGRVRRQATEGRRAGIHVRQSIAGAPACIST